MVSPAPRKRVGGAEGHPRFEAMLEGRMACWVEVGRGRGGLEEESAIWGSGRAGGKLNPQEPTHAGRGPSPRALYREAPRRSRWMPLMWACLSASLCKRFRVKVLRVEAWAEEDTMETRTPRFETFHVRLLEEALAGEGTSLHRNGRLSKTK